MVMQHRTNTCGHHNMLCVAWQIVLIIFAFISSSDLFGLFIVLIERGYCMNHVIGNICHRFFHSIELITLHRMTWIEFSFCQQQQKPQNSTDIEQHFDVFVWWCDNETNESKNFFYFIHSKFRSVCAATMDFCRKEIEVVVVQNSFSTNERNQMVWKDPDTT